MQRAECAFDVLNLWRLGDYSSEGHDTPLFREADHILWRAQMTGEDALELACTPRPPCTHNGVIYGNENGSWCQDCGAQLSVSTVTYTTVAVPFKEGEVG